MKKVLPFSLSLNIILLLLFFVLIYKMGGFRHFIYKIKNRGLAGIYQHRVEHLETLHIHKGDIVFLGNSLTQYAEWDELLQNPTVKNRGIAGDGVEGVLQRLESVLTAEPSTIFLMIGINDLFFHDAAFVLRHYERILQKCKQQSPNTQVVVQSILPVNSDIKAIPIDNQTIVNLNKQIRTLSKKYGYPYLDVHALMKDENGKLNPQFSVDGIHINGAAYLRWRDLIKEQYFR